MNAPLELGQCLSFINCQLMPNERAVLPLEEKLQWRVVTISRQAGTGAHLVAEMLAQLLRARGPEGVPSWAVIDRNLAKQVLEDLHLPERFSRFMPEDRISEFHNTLDELFGLHPPDRMLVEKTGETILRLAELGNVIMIGRAANIVTSKLEYAFHVRLVGALDARAEFIQEDRKLDRKAALELIHADDEGRKRYVRKYYHKDVDDPSLYHLIINTPVVGHVAAARIIAETILSNQTEPLHLVAARR